MERRGIVERVVNGKLFGWARVVGGRTRSDVRIQAKLAGAVISEGPLGGVRADVSTFGFDGYSFELQIHDSQVDRLDEISLFLDEGGVLHQISLWRPVEAAVLVNCLSESQQKVFRNSLSTKAHSGLRRHFSDGDRFVPARGLAAIVCYANDSGGWFEYFYRYYSTIFGSGSIYLVTPRPESFKQFADLSVLSVAGRDFDDQARSRLMSGLASGLQAYYEWVGVCDVDEFIVPLPWVRRSLPDVLRESSHNVIRTLGLDVVERPGDPPFDMARSIVEQRVIAVPNTALSKPHFSRTPQKYSGGFHFSSDRGCPPSEAKLATLHLKWACSAVRRDVLRMVIGTNYSDKAVADYCRSSVEVEVHPALRNGDLDLIEPDNSRWIDFEEAAYERERFFPDRGFFVGKWEVANFLVRLSGDWA